MSARSLVAEPSAAVRQSWLTRLRSACRGAGVRTVFQPIADLAGARTAGYEALTRFGRGTGSPLQWLTAARRHGCAGDLEARALRTALHARAALPPNCFLTVNVSPDLLRHPAIAEVWRDQRDLSGIVVELTEQVPIESYRDLEPELDALRGAGALLAVDDAGAGYAGLRHVVALRPAIVKLDRSLVRDVDRDEAKRAMIEMVGGFASRIDAWVVAEGVERAEELEALAALGVPLAQGYFLGHPASGWTGLSPGATQLLRTAAGQSRGMTLRAVLESAPTARSLADAQHRLADGSVPLVVLVDEYERPVTAVRAPLWDTEPGMRANLDTPLAEAAARAMTRPPAQRFAPLLCTDKAGRFIGIARVERLMLALATRESSTEQPAGVSPR